MRVELLLWKVVEEDLVRSGGAPFAIVRPCALTEEPGGMPIELSQGDTIKVRADTEREPGMLMLYQCLYCLDASQNHQRAPRV
jgi:hypothetical protein